MSKQNFNQAAANDNGPNPDRELLRAAEGGDLEKVKFWLERGANINARQTNNDTAVILATREGHDDIVRYLAGRKTKPADLTLTNNEGQTALHVAARGGLTSVAQVLLKSGAPADVRDNEGVTAAFYAAQGGNDVLIDVLAAAKADINQPDNKKTTPLMEATKNNQPKAAAALLQAKAETDAQDAAGMTALMHAVEADQRMLVQAMAAQGANIELQDGKSRTAISIARDLGHSDMADMLEDAVKKVHAERYGAFHTGTKDSVSAMRPLALKPSGEPS